MKKTQTPATEALNAAGVEFTVLTYEHEGDAHAFGDESAEKLGRDPHCVFKTLIAKLTGARYSHVCAVVPVAGHLDLKALAAHVGAKKAEMADAKEAQRLTGYVVGGISPAGQRRQLPLVVDESAALLDVMIVSGGRRGMSLELVPGELVRALGGSFAAIGRD